MSEEETLTFQLPLSWQVVLPAIFIAGRCGMLAIDFHFRMLKSAVPELITIPAWLLAWIFLMPYYTVQLRPDGIKLYSLWWLPWADVGGVTYSRLFGFPHFRVKRSRGFPWSIPLYFVGNCDLGPAIVRAAPPGNPFKSVSNHGADGVA